VPSGPDSFDGFRVATKRCTYGGTELSLGPSTPLRLSERSATGQAERHSGSNPCYLYN
jgi:hypothetical protein